MHVQLAERHAEPAERGARSESWKLEALPPSSHFLDFIPGRDTLVPASDLAAGVHTFCPLRPRLHVCSPGFPVRLSRSRLWHDCYVARSCCAAACASAYACLEHLMESGSMQCGQVCHGDCVLAGIGCA